MPRLCWFLITRRNSKCCTIASLMLPGRDILWINYVSFWNPNYFYPNFQGSILFQSICFLFVDGLSCASFLQADVPLCSISLFTFQTLCAHYILSDLGRFCFPLLLQLSSRLMFPSAFHCWLIPDLLTDLLPQTGICQSMKIIYLREKMTRKIYG